METRDSTSVCESIFSNRLVIVVLNFLQSVSRAYLLCKPWPNLLSNYAASVWMTEMKKMRPQYIIDQLTVCFSTRDTEIRSLLKSDLWTGWFHTAFVGWLVFGAYSWSLE